ncbi:MAG: mannose-1-phosphate guanylyltransferase [Anaerolineae bacterium]|nr:mannose-1-phosphate guanylyltransferase [Anaerolineae bacterium]
MTEHLYALIMAGGGGTRLWPLSRREHPKQMLTLFGNRTMFQVAVDRLRPLLPPERIFVVTAERQVAPLSSQVPDLPTENFIVEPMGRGTASCIGLSALHIRQRDPDAVMAVLTADHVILKEDVFRDVLLAAQECARQGYLMTLGIQPTEPSTGYGYICQGEVLDSVEGFDCFQVERFTEKPDTETALKFLEAGNYVWNSGMFIWSVQHILEEIHTLMPGLHGSLEKLATVLNTPDYATTLNSIWPLLHKETIDYGIMEKAQKVAVLPVDLGWSDVGSWASVMVLHNSDETGNVQVGESMLIDTENTMIFSSGNRFVATVGVKDLVIVDTPDALLVVPREQAQRVRDIVSRLTLEGHSHLL